MGGIPCRGRGRLLTVKSGIYPDFLSKIDVFLLSSSYISTAMHGRCCRITLSVHSGHKEWTYVFHPHCSGVGCKHPPGINYETCVVCVINLYGDEIYISSISVPFKMERCGHGKRALRELLIHIFAKTRLDYNGMRDIRVTCQTHNFAYEFFERLGFEVDTGIDSDNDGCYIEMSTTFGDLMRRLNKK